jgi:radical SAM superfamily enzyme YgiQ (UPF0313 family)
LSAYLKLKGHKVKVLDGLNLGWPDERIAGYCADADCVGISVLSSYLKESISISKLLKAQGKTVIIGGPHVSALASEALKETGADFAVCGEGEIPFSLLIDAISGGRDRPLIPGVLTPFDKEAVVKLNFIDDLDSLPFPDWAQINPRDYKKAPHGGLIKKFPVAPVVTSRGCPYECTFCASPKLWDRKIRFRSPENTVDEISYLVKNFGVKEIHFEDDNLTLKKEHITGICELILKRKIKINWATPNGVRADSLDAGMLSLMKKSGCYYLAFGIESANFGILNNIKKHTKIEIIQRAIDLSRREGILTQGFFIFGLPGETRETIRETINFAKQSGLDRAQFLLLDVLPGSELWDSLKDSRCADIKVSKSYQDVTWLPQGLDEETLLNSQSEAFRSFFLRPKQLFNIMKYFKFSQLSFILKRVSDYRIIKKKRM